KLDPELSQVDGLSVADHLPSGAAQKIVLSQLSLNDPHGKLGRVNRKIHLPQHIGQSTDMVLMSMGDDKSLYLPDIFLQIGDVRNYQVDPQHIVLREGQTAVHDNNTVFTLKGSNVHSDLLQSSQRNDTQFSI